MPTRIKTVDIVDQNITTIKLADDAVTSDKILTDAVGLDALDESITPTWSGLHTFSSGIDLTGGAIDLDPTGEYQLDLAVGSNARVTLANTGGGVWAVQRVDGQQYLLVDPTGDAIRYGMLGGLDNPTHSFYGNVDATNGLDVTGADLTLVTGGGEVFSVSQSTGNVTIPASGWIADEAGGDIGFQDNIFLPTDKKVKIGSSDNLELLHDSVSGDVILDSTQATASIRLRTGTNTSATSIRLESDSGAAIVEVFGSGLVDMESALAVTVPTPLASNDAATKAYVDSQVNVGFDHAMATIVADGIEDTWDLDHVNANTSLVNDNTIGMKITRNGLEMEHGSGSDGDFTISAGTGAGGVDQIVFNSPPALNARIIIRYYVTL